MKWKVYLNGEGQYWWLGETPIGEFYVCSGTAHRDVAVEWYPFNTNGDPIVVAKVETEDAGKAAAEAHVKQIARKLKRWLR